MEGSKPRTEFRVRPMLTAESAGTLSAAEDNAGEGRAGGGLKVGSASWCFDQTPLDMPERLPDKSTPDEEERGVDIWEALQPRARFREEEKAAQTEPEKPRWDSTAPYLSRGVCPTVKSHVGEEGTGSEWPELLMPGRQLR